MGSMRGSGSIRMALLLVCAWTPVHAAPVETATSADLARHYFASPAAEVAARADLDSALARLERLRGRLDSADRLLEAMRANDAVLDQFARHEGYLHFVCSQDRASDACDLDERLSAEVVARMAFLEPEVVAIPEARLREFLGQEAGLARYAHALAELRRDDAHVLAGGVQAVLDRFQPLITGWPYDLYQQTLSGIRFGTVRARDTTLDVLRQRNLVAADPDRAVREEGFRKRWAGYASQRDLFAFALLHQVRAQSELAKVHGEADAPARKYRSLGFDPDSTRALLRLMAEHADVVRRYERVRGADFERDHHEPARAWDLGAPSPGVQLPRATIESARRIYHDAFAGLGREYQGEFDALLDPANGRVDIRPGGAPGRYGGGFSIGASTSPSMLFYGRWDGTFKDLSVVAHEGGHAVHRQLMSNHHVLPCDTQGPDYLFESFAAFDELVLADAMATRTRDPGLSRYYRERWLDIKGLDAFYGAEDALLEQAIYDGVATDSIHDADDLDRLTARVCAPFSGFVAGTPELHSRWAAVSLMVEDPLYDVSYVYGGLLALQYWHLYRTRHDWFVPRYLALLSGGFDAPPADLLRRTLGIEMSGSRLLADGLQVLDDRLRELESGR